MPYKKFTLSFLPILLLGYISVFLICSSFNINIPTKIPQGHAIKQAFAHDPHVTFENIGFLGTNTSGHQKETLRETYIALETETPVPQEVERVYRMTSTAYAPFDNQSGMCADDNPNSTATGTVPGPGTIAVNPELIPYGSKLLIIGDGWEMEGTALDTGGAMRQDPYKIDIFHWTYEEAIKFGRQAVTVIVRE